MYIDHALVHVIFTNNHTVKLLPDRLPYGVMDVSAALVDDTMYGFGGYDGKFITSWFTYVVVLFWSKMCDDVAMI